MIESTSQTPPTLQLFYTVEQTAAALQLHPTTIRRFCRQGRIKAVQYGRQWRIFVPAGTGVRL